MKAIKCDLPYADTIEIHPMADLHIGDSQFGEQKYAKAAHYIPQKYAQKSERGQKYAINTKTRKVCKEYSA